MVGIEALNANTALYSQNNQSLYGMLSEVDPYMTMLGPILQGGVTPQRYFESLSSSITSNFNSTESMVLSRQDAEINKPIVNELDAKRLFGKRYAEHEMVSQILNNEDANKTLAIYMQYSAEKGGLKNPNDPNITWANLKDPGLLIKDSTWFLAGLTGIGKRTEPIKSLENIAVKTQSGELAAQLLINAGSGICTEEKTFEALLVNSAQKMSKGEYNRFITNTAAAYQKATGNDFIEFIKEQYSVLGVIEIPVADSEGDAILQKVLPAIQNTSNAGNAMTISPMMGMSGMLGMHGIG